MGVPVLILGESGTGKSTSLRNFKEGEIAIVNVAGKPLPFRGKFETLNNTIDYGEIIRFMRNTKAKRIVIDDAQYIMSFQYMRRIKENGWDKFNELQSDFFNLIDFTRTLPDDVIVYFLSHLETTSDGRQKIKTIGKMLDEKITIEGMFTTVLKTHVADGKYSFLTQNSGNDTTKSPLGMFNSYAIDNDLKYVDEKIRNYYFIGDYKSDEEMAIEDEKVAVAEIEKPTNGRTRRSRKSSQLEGQIGMFENEPKTEQKEEPKQTPAETQNEPQNASEEPTKQRRTRKVRTTSEEDPF